MNPPSPDKITPRSTSGAIFGAAAFLIWGISPLYWKTLTAVPALEIVAHRVVWSFLLLMPLILIRKRWKEFLLALTNWRSMAILAATSLFVSCNWLVYIWAINNGFLLQASLGYYINPLVNVLLGTLFLKERLRSFQGLAVLLAGAGVLYLTVVYGQFPWIACILAFTFGLYGLVRKIISVGSLVGLTMETFLLTVPALGYLIYLDTKGSAAFFKMSLQIDLLLMGTSVVTALPLLLFAMSARRVRLTTLGFLQYIAPSCMFVMAVFLYLETFRMEQLISFILIWAALAVYSIDSVVYYRRSGTAK
ncbi:EamA family transporter RarD [Desulfobacterales bacterium]|nr:EamA family transporter RarD [Desulfobacterales bacterium]